jgi:NAD(P)H-binding
MIAAVRASRRGDLGALTPMSTVLIIGASKGIGLETVRLALKAGHSVRALSRSAIAIRLHDPKLEKLNGDALDRDTIDRALVGVDAVIQTRSRCVASSACWLQHSTRWEREAAEGGKSTNRQIIRTVLKLGSSGPLFFPILRHELWITARLKQRHFLVCACPLDPPS